MTCITCTDKGRIFLAGRDGHIYELHYTTGSGWQKRCRKVCLTAGLGSVISRYVLYLMLYNCRQSWSLVIVPDDSKCLETYNLLTQSSVEI